jgi:hypothetical protein
MRSGFRCPLLVTLLLLPACQRQALHAPETPAQVTMPGDTPLARRDKAAGLIRDLGRTVDAEEERTDYRPIRSIATSMIIRSGTASIAIDTLDVAIGRLRDLAVRTGGYIANTDIQAVEGGVRNATMEIKVPADRFDELLRGLTPLGRVEQVTVSAQDVGEEFSDITARVANGHRLEQRLTELIATRTGKLSDVLEIERELARVREEIERMQGRLRYLEAHAAVSSLTVRIHEPAPLVGEEGSLAVLAEAARQAWRNTISLAASAIAALGVVLPVALLGVLAFFGLRTRRRRPA